MKNKIIKEIVVILFALIIGVFLGAIVNIIYKVRNQERMVQGTSLIQSDMYGDGIRCSISNNKDETMKSTDQFSLDNNMIEFNINMENYSNDNVSCYLAVVLIDSVQTEFSCNNVSDKAIKIIPNHKGLNKFKCTLSNIHKFPDDIEILLLGKGKENYIFKFSNKDTYDENYILKDTGFDNVEEGIYINSKYYDSSVFSSKKLFRINDYVSIPFLIKTGDENEKFNIYMFDENGIQYFINNKSNLCIKCNSDNVYEGVIKINNITKKEVDYKLVVIPTDTLEYNYLFSEKLTVIGED